MRAPAVLLQDRPHERPGWATPTASRPAVFAAAAALFVAVTVLRWFVDRSGQAAALLYVVPIALLALAWGRRAGLVAAAAGSALFAVFALARGQGDLDVTGWLDPLLTMLLVGGVLGDRAQRAAEKEIAARAEHERRQAVELLCSNQQEALEVTDHLLQGVAAAKWMMETGNTEQALQVLTLAVGDSMARLSGALPPPGAPSEPGKLSGGARVYGERAR